MSSNDTIYAEAIAAGITPQALQRATNGRVYKPGFVASNADVSRIDLLIRMAETAQAEATTQPTVTLATPRQVDLIMSLLAKRRRDGDGGGFFRGPTTREGVATLTKHDASAYIDSLTGAY